MYALASNDETSGSLAEIFSKRLAAGWNLPLPPKYFMMPAVRWLDTMDATWISGSEPTCQPDGVSLEVCTLLLVSPYLCRIKLQLPGGSVVRLQV
jgi:hypothetical protein